MTAAGYSGTPLLQKLGIKAGMSILLINAPADYFLWLGTGIIGQLVSRPPADLVHIFATSRKELASTFNSLIKKLPPDAVIWISWYKKAAKIPTDITEDVIREIVLPAGWVDIKVCAVSEQWSGLKIVQRVEHRKK